MADSTVEKTAALMGQIKVEMMVDEMEEMTAVYLEDSLVAY